MPDPDPTFRFDADPDPDPTPSFSHIFNFCSQQRQSQLFYLLVNVVGVIIFNILESALEFSRISIVQLYLW